MKASKITHRNEARIRKVSIHSLRHIAWKWNKTFVTYKGYRYTHHKGFDQIKNPLDKLEID